MSLRITPGNKHQPVFTRDFVERVANSEDERAVDLLQFNANFPTKRHWHHRVHTAFGLPCDDLCKPKPSYTGGDLIQRIKARYRIEDIAGLHTKLQGNEVLSGKCPLHGERNGESFKIWVDDQKFSCFGRCGLHGDVIDLVRALTERGMEWK